jgi:hypothetical protein
LRDGDDFVLLELVRRRRAGLDVHEEVALEEDARADLELGVALDREAHLLDLHRHLGRTLALLHRLDLHDLAHLHAGDPDRRARLQVVHVVEDGLELVRVRERVRLREAEVREQADHDDRQDAGAEGAHSVAAPAHGTSLRLSIPSSRIL